MPMLLSFGVKTLGSNRNDCGMAFLLLCTLFSMSQYRYQFSRKFSCGRSCCTVVGAVPRLLQWGTGGKGELCSK